MGILRNTVSCCQFKITGPVPKENLEDWALECIQKRGFTSIADSNTEKSVGWVSIDDINDSSFFNAGTVLRKPYIVFAMRIDQRKVPASVLKHTYEHKCRQWLAEHPDFQWVPKDRKADIKELAHLDLLGKTLPVPTVVDALWNTEKNILTVTSLTSTQLDEFDGLFRETFDQLGIEAIHPYARAANVLDPKHHSRLEQYNESTSDSVVDMIKDNKWLGRDFLLWLTHQSIVSASDYVVTQPGPAFEGQPFVSYVNNRLILVGVDGDSEQKIIYSGPQAQFDEVRAALRMGKQISEATLHIERDEEEWKLTLKAEQFHFSSFKSPKVQIERDDLTDEASEKEAVFYERMHLLETGLQLFDSLYEEFLKVRLSNEWNEKKKAAKKWYEQGH